MDDKGSKKEDLELLIRFISKTKEGKYVYIDPKIQSTPRAREERFEIIEDCDYYYSIR